MPVVACPGLPSLSWAATVHTTRRTQPRRVAIPSRLRTELIMSDLQTVMGDDILQMTVCLRVRDGKEAVEQLKAIYPDEAKNAELDITAKFKLEVR